MEHAYIKTSRLRQMVTNFANDICIFLNENVYISIMIALKFIPKGQNSRIGSDNGLAPARRQAIIWTNDGKFTDVYMRHSAPMG